MTEKLIIAVLIMGSVSAISVTTSILYCRRKYRKRKTEMKREIEMLAQSSRYSLPPSHMGLHSSVVAAPMPTPHKAALHTPHHTMSSRGAYPSTEMPYRRSVSAPLPDARFPASIVRRHQSFQLEVPSFNQPPCAGHNESRHGAIPRRATFAGNTDMRLGYVAPNGLRKVAAQRRVPTPPPRPDFLTAVRDASSHGGEGDGENEADGTELISERVYSSIRSVHVDSLSTNTAQADDNRAACTDQTATTSNALPTSSEARFSLESDQRKNQHIYEVPQIVIEECESSDKCWPATHFPGPTATERRRARQLEGTSTTQRGVPLKAWQKQSMSRTTSDTTAVLSRQQ